MSQELDKAMLQMVTMIETKVKLEKTKVAEILSHTFNEIKEHLLINGQVEIDRAWIASKLDALLRQIKGDE